MTTITRERLEHLANFRGAPVTRQEEQELARIALASLEANPVAWTDEQELRDVEKHGCGYLFTVNPITPNADPSRVIKLYTAPPLPVVNAEPVAWQFKAVNGEWISISGTGKDQAVSEGCEIRQLYTTPPTLVVPEIDRRAIADKVYGKCCRIPGATFYNAAEFAIDEVESLRAAMLQAGNSPVTPDGWINCRERLPKPNKYVLVCNGVWVGVGMYNNAELFEDDEHWQDEHGEFIDLLHHPVTHWQSLPAAPKQTEG